MGAEGGYVGIGLKPPTESGRHTAKLQGARCLKPYRGKTRMLNLNTLHPAPKEAIGHSDASPFHFALLSITTVSSLVRVLALWMMQLRRLPVW